MRELQRLHNRTVLTEHAPAIRFLILVAGEILWPFWSVRVALRLIRQNGSQVRRRNGPRPTGQFFAMLRLAQTHLWHPRDYYYFNLWHPDRGAPADYLPDGRAQRMLFALNRGTDLSILDDKRRFWEFCRTLAFPTPPLLGVFSAGHFEPLADEASLAQDLFVKPRRGSHARGTSRWLYDASSGTYDGPANSRGLSRRELIARYSRLSAAEDYLVQPRLRDHPSIADMSNGALSTIRMITITRIDGLVAEFASILNLPTRSAVINNLSDGAIACPVDSATGRLRAAFSGALGKPRFTTNPFNNSPLVGRLLPHWAETVALARAAHEKIARVPLIGWDIAVTGDGPVLLEGNHGIGLNFHQLPPNPPLGRTELPSLLLWHLRRKFPGHCPRGNAG